MAGDASSLKILNAGIVACDRCPRPREYCAEVARVRRRAYTDCEYWGRPVGELVGGLVLVGGRSPGAAIERPDPGLLRVPGHGHVWQSIHAGWQPGGQHPLDRIGDRKS